MQEQRADFSPFNKLPTVLCSSMALAFPQEKHMGVRCLLRLQALARPFIRTIEECSSREPSPLAREREDVARARILLAQKKPTEALSLLEPLRGGAERQERWDPAIEMQGLH